MQRVNTSSEFKRVCTYLASLAFDCTLTSTAFTLFKELHVKGIRVQLTLA